MPNDQQIREGTDAYAHTKATAAVPVTAKISVVIPVYRSRESLPILLERLERELRTIGRPYEVVLVDDCSPDDTWTVLKKLKEERPWLKIARLLRNSGQHNAILCGFTIADGDVVVTMDDDLQNPPEEVHKLIAAIDQGYDLAIAAYDAKKHDGLRNLGGKLIDSMQRRIFGLPPSFQLTSFRAVRRIIVANVVLMGGSYPYVTSMLLSHTSRYINIPVRHEERRFGKSNYTLKNSVLLMLNLVLNYSSYPLYLVAGLSFVAFTFSATFGLWTLWRAAVYGAFMEGWASTIIIVSLLNALILLALVIQGVYLSRLNQQISRSRVSFTVGEFHG
jgi:glycosyltransferase involved in cell wall biosynthesis